MNEINDNNCYYFEYKNKNIDLKDFLKEYIKNNNDNKIIIYIKKDKEINIDDSNNIKVRNRKPYDFHINYNNINEGAFINVLINISNKKKNELKNTLENIDEHITKEICELDDFKNIKKESLYINNPNKNSDNNITFVCRFIPDIKTKVHRIYEIKEYLTNYLWNKDKFPYERVKKGYKELSEFKNILIETNKKNQQLKIYPDFEPVIIINRKENNIIIKIEYNIRQIFFVKPKIIPDPLC